MCNKTDRHTDLHHLYYIHRELSEEKSKEKANLVQAVRNVRDISKNHINEMHEVVDTKIKTMAWNSHARQTKAMEACSKLKREFDDTLHEHVGTETTLRHANIVLETEISQMITE